MRVPLLPLLLLALPATAAPKLKEKPPTVTVGVTFRSPDHPNIRFTVVYIGTGDAGPYVHALGDWLGDYAGTGLVRPYYTIPYLRANPEDGVLCDATRWPTVEEVRKLIGGER